MVRYSTVSYSKYSHRYSQHSPVVRAEGEPPIALNPGCLPLAISSIADVATNLSPNLAKEELRTCGRNGTVNGEHLEYSGAAEWGSGENRCGSRGPLEMIPQNLPPGALTTSIKVVKSEYISQSSQCSDVQAILVSSLNQLPYPPTHNHSYAVGNVDEGS